MAGLALTRLEGCQGFLSFRAVSRAPAGTHPAIKPATGPNIPLYATLISRDQDVQVKEGRDEDEPQDPLLSLAENFEQIYNRALDGRPAQLKALFGTSSRWIGLPLAEKAGAIQPTLDMLDQARNFMLEPRMSVTGTRIDRKSHKVEVDWELSGTWPLPYRPRVRAAGTSTLTVDPRHQGSAPLVTTLEEKWDKPWWQYALAQCLPRGWDIWHLYLTPPAEKPLYRVVKKCAAIEVREYYPRLVIELEQYDNRRDKDRKFTEYAWLLPDFSFTDELKLQGRAQYRETYVTTSPLEVCVESTEWAAEGEQAGLAKRIRWHVPVPSHVGLNATALPVPNLTTNATLGEAGRYVLQPRRLMAVRGFKGQTQTSNYATARRWLLEWVKKEGLKTVKNEKGKSRVWVQNHNMKGGFNMKGNFCLGIYEQPMFSDWAEIAVEIADYPDDLGPR